MERRYDKNCNTFAYDKLTRCIPTSRRHITKSFTSLGLSQTETRIYIYLSTNGPQNASKIGDSLKLKEQLTHQSLEKLQDKGVVTFVGEKPLFLAVPFDKALELLMKAHLKEAQAIEENRDEILSKWKKLVTERTAG